MSQSISFFKQYWFSIGLALIVSLSVVKRFEVCSLHTHSKTMLTKPAPVAVNAKLVAAKTPILPIPVKETTTDPQPSYNSLQFTKAEQQAHRDFILRFTKVAKDEMAKYSIPASIILAHALIESNGKTGKDNTNNNFFNLPCTDAPSTKVCSRKYKTAWFSFRDHSKYITTGKFKYLPRIPISNLEEWAKGLQVIGHPNQQGYNERLLDIVKLYELDLLDGTSEKA